MTEPSFIAIKEENKILKEKLADLTFFINKNQHIYRLKPDLNSYCRVGETKRVNVAVREREHARTYGSETKIENTCTVYNSKLAEAFVHDMLRWFHVDGLKRKTGSLETEKFFLRPDFIDKCMEIGSRKINEGYEEWINVLKDSFNIVGEYATSIRTTPIGDFPRLKPETNLDNIMPEVISKDPINKIIKHSRDRDNLKATIVPDREPIILCDNKYIKQLLGELAKLSNEELTALCVPKNCDKIFITNTIGFGMSFTITEMATEIYRLK